MVSKTEAFDKAAYMKGENLKCSVPTRPSVSCKGGRIRFSSGPCAAPLRKALGTSDGVQVCSCRIPKSTGALPSTFADSGTKTLMYVLDISGHESDSHDPPSLPPKLPKRPGPPSSTPDSALLYIITTLRVYYYPRFSTRVAGYI